jgi:hypothetical protein
MSTTDKARAVMPSGPPAGTTTAATPGRSAHNQRGTRREAQPGSYPPTADQLAPNTSAYQPIAGELHAEAVAQPASEQDAVVVQQFE